MDILKELEEAKWEEIQEAWDHYMINCFYTTQWPMWKVVKGFCKHHNLKFEEWREHIVRKPETHIDWHSSPARFIAKNFSKLNTLLYNYADRRAEMFDKLVKKFSSSKQMLDPRELIKMSDKSKEKRRDVRQYKTAIANVALDLAVRDASYKSNWKVYK